MSIVLDGTAGITTPQVTTDDGEAYAPGNILGTVSQSGGVPTGSIIERGSNANGEFVKYADGTQICYRFFTVTSGQADWTFPVAFAGATTDINLQGTPRGEVNGRWIDVIPASMSAATVRTKNTSNDATEIAASVLAVGRWF